MAKAEELSGGFCVCIQKNRYFLWKESVGPGKAIKVPQDWVRAIRGSEPYAGGVIMPWLGSKRCKTFSLGGRRTMTPELLHSAARGIA
jgi:hypothetical protein